MNKYPLCQKAAQARILKEETTHNGNASLKIAYSFVSGVTLPSELQKSAFLFGFVNIFSFSEKRNMEKMIEILKQGTTKLLVAIS